MIDPAAAPLATGRACASEQEDPGAAPKAPANNLEQFCLLMCRGLEVKKVSVHTSSKTPYSRIIWMHSDREQARLVLFHLPGAAPRAGPHVRLARRGGGE